MSIAITKTSKETRQRRRALTSAPHWPSCAFHYPPRFCMYVFYYIAHNRAIRPRNGKHSMLLGLTPSGGINGYCYQENL